MLTALIFLIYISASIFPHVSSNGADVSGMTNGRAVGLRSENELRELYLSAETRLERCRADVRRATEDLKKRELQANRIKLQLRNKMLLAERKELEAVKARKIADAAQEECVSLQAESTVCITGAANGKRALETLVQEAKAAEVSFSSLKIELQQQSNSNRVHLRAGGSSRTAVQHSRPMDHSRLHAVGFNRSLAVRRGIGSTARHLNVPASGAGSTRYGKTEATLRRSLSSSQALPNARPGPYL